MLSKKGFTIIEILIVVSIISLISSIIIPSSIKTYTKFNTKLEKEKHIIEQEKEDFLKFISDNLCTEAGNQAKCIQTDGIFGGQNDKF